MSLRSRLLPLFLVLAAPLLAAAGLPAAPASRAVGPLARAVLTPVSRVMLRTPGVVFYLPTRTELDVLDDGGPEFRFWRKSLFVDWRSDYKLKSLPFRWTTKQPKVQSAVWQVGIFPFTPDTANWRRPAGLVASGSLTEVPAAGQYARFQVDFTAFAPRPPSAAAVAAAGPRPIVGSRLVLPAGPARARATFLRAHRLTYRQSLPALAGAGGAPVRYYVRVVSLGVNGACLGTPAVPLEVTVGQTPDQPPVELVDPSMQNARHPVAVIAHYQPIRFEQPDALYHVIVTRDPLAGVPLFSANSPYRVGQKLDLTPKHEDKSWWESFCEAVGDFFGAVVSALNWVANAYDAIKAFVVSTLVSVLGDWAQGPLSAGLDIGLAAIGLPPSIPDFDDLTNMGADYLAETIADQTGIPAEVARKGVDAMVSEAKKTAAGGGNPAAWFRPDPDYYYRPAYLQVELANPTGQTTDRMVLSVKNQGTDNPVFEDAHLPIPPLAPGQRLTVPVFLKENTGPGYVTSDPSSYNWPTHETWRQEYHNKRKVVFSIATTAVEPRQNWGKTQQTLQLDTKVVYDR